MSTTVTSIDSLPLIAQHDAWRHALGELSLRSELPDQTVLSGDIALLRSPSGAALARLRSVAQRLTSAGAAKPQSPLLIIFHGLGRGRVTGGASAHEFAAGNLTVCDPAKPFTVTFREDFEFIALEASRERLLPRLGGARLRLPAVLGATVAAAAAAPLMRTLAANFDTLGAADIVAIELALTELLVGALLGEVASESEHATQVQTAHFRRAAAAIETRLTDANLTMAQIAAQEALSQRYLQKLFELQDTTFSDYVRQRRLDRTRLELIDPRHASEGIQEIAFRWGFRDPAHFSRAFSAAFGESPRAFRVRANVVSQQGHLLRGRPLERSLPHNAVVPGGAPRAAAHIAEMRERAESLDNESADRHRIAVHKDTVHWGYLSGAIPPVLRVDSGAEVRIETLTQHAFDDHARMIKGDAGAESVFGWTAAHKNVDRRGAGPMNASIFGRGAGEGFGVHIFTGPVFINGAMPGDVLEVQILDIEPRPSANPDYAGRCFASNASAWWGYQYSDLIGDPKPREVITIYEADGAFARAVYSYRWTPQIDPFGVRHDTIDYPGIPVDPATVVKTEGIMPRVRVPLRPHFGCMAVAPRGSDLVDSIPPGNFGGNLDNWRAGKGTKLYLPVAVAGALFSVGDGHLSQGDGEINGTGLEASLTGTFRFVLHKKDEHAPRYLRGLNVPLIETADEFVLHGFSYPNYLRDLGRNAQSEVYKKSSLNKALRSAFRTTRKFLMEAKGLSEDEALSLISVAVDFGITQVADGNWGVHAVIRKSMFE